MLKHETQKTPNIHKTRKKYIFYNLWIDQKLGENGDFLEILIQKPKNSTFPSVFFKFKNILFIWNLKSTFLVIPDIVNIKY